MVNGGIAGTKCLASINVTHLENNAHFVMARPEDIIAIQEHKLSAKGIGEMMETFRLSGWSLMCGPAEHGSKRINAGVGMASHSCNIIRGDRTSDDFEKAYQLGRVDKYIIDNGGLKDNIVVFVIYGKSGGSKHARAITDAIIAAIRKEMGPCCNQPVLIMGDFNAEPNSLMQAKELMDDEAWIDVGAVASWWGGIDNQPTCLQRAEVQETRIDGVLANSMAISFIRGYTVEKDPMIPTHYVVKLHLDLETEGEKRSFIKTLPSLKYMLDDKIAKETAEMEDAKEKTKKAREIREDLHKMMDKQLKDRQYEFEYHISQNDMDSYWKSWSTAVERAWIQLVDPTKEFMKAAKRTRFMHDPANEAQEETEEKRGRAGYGQEYRSLCSDSTTQAEQKMWPAGGKTQKDDKDAEAQ